MTEGPPASMVLLLGLALTVSFGVTTAEADTRESLTNVPICTAPGQQFDPRIVSDGSGGALITWEDHRVGNSDIYVHHVLHDGTADPTWPLNGLATCTLSSDQMNPTIAADGTGGAIVAWWDRRSGSRSEVFAQHVLASGSVDPTWPQDGRALAAVTTNQTYPQVVSDGSGGAIVAWYDQVTVSARDIYAQHVLPTGSMDPAWPANGRVLCVAGGDQYGIAVESDGAGSAFVTWQDRRNADLDIFAQWISSSGATRWTANGAPVCIASGDQEAPSITRAGPGSAIVGWQDRRSGGQGIYAQLISASGSPQWTLNGVPIHRAVSQDTPAAVTDGAGGAVVAWRGTRGDAVDDIYAQHVTPSGTLDDRWPTDGSALCTAIASQWQPKGIADGAGGAIVTWYDFRDGTSDIYAQRILAEGTPDPVWPIDGRALCRAADDQRDPELVSDGAGGAIVVWEDWRKGFLASDIFVQKVRSDGSLADTYVDVPSSGPSALEIAAVRPNPVRNGALTVHFTLASTAAATLSLFDVAGRRVTELRVASPDPGRRSLELATTPRLAAGLYVVRLEQAHVVRTSRVVVLD